METKEASKLPRAERRRQKHMKRTSNTTGYFTHAFVLDIITGRIYHKAVMHRLAKNQEGKPVWVRPQFCYGSLEEARAAYKELINPKRNESNTKQNASPNHKRTKSGVKEKGATTG